MPQVSLFAPEPHVIKIMPQVSAVKHVTHDCTREFPWLCWCCPQWKMFQIKKNIETWVSWEMQSRCCITQFQLQCQQHVKLLLYYIQKEQPGSILWTKLVQLGKFPCAVMRDMFDCTHLRHDFDDVIFNVWHVWLDSLEAWFWWRHF